MANVRVTTRVGGLTAERVIFKQLGAYVPGAVEKALGATKGLGAKPDLLPAGTTIVIPQPTAAELVRRVEIIRLGD